MRLLTLIGTVAFMSVAAPSMAQNKPAAAIPAPTPLPATYQLLCQASVSTGLDWSASDWKSVKFKPETHIIQIGSPSFCPSLKDQGGLQETVFAEFRTRKVCGNIRTVGEPLIPIASQQCSEFYSWKDRAWHVSLSCDGDHTLRAELNGWYHMTYLHGDLSVAQDRKDSLSVEAGKCSVIR